MSSDNSSINRCLFIYSLYQGQLLTQVFRPANASKTNIATNAKTMYYTSYQIPPQILYYYFHKSKLREKPKDYLNEVHYETTFLLRKTDYVSIANFLLLQTTLRYPASRCVAGERKRRHIMSPFSRKNY